MKKGQFVILLAVVVLCVGGIFGFVYCKLDKIENGKTEEKNNNLEENNNPNQEVKNNFITKINSILEEEKNKKASDYEEFDEVPKASDVTFKERKEGSISYYKAYYKGEPLSAVDEIKVYQNETNDILSFAILVNNDYAYGYKLDIDVYNVDAKTGVELTSEDIIKKYNISNELFTKSIKNGYLSFVDEENIKKTIKDATNNGIEEDWNLWIKDINNQIDDIRNNNYLPNDYKLFLNESAKLSTLLTKTTNLSCIGGVLCEGATKSKIIEINKENGQKTFRNYVSNNILN